MGPLVTTEREQVVDIEKFLADRERNRKESERVAQLIQRYKQQMPAIETHWDTTAQSARFNDIDNAILSKGVTIYECDSEALWSGVFKPEVYEGSTLWDSSHADHKIALIIEAWEQENALSPIFLVKHGAHNVGLVADGKHRLTVSRAIQAKRIPFMVEKNSAWVGHAIPSARPVSEFTLTL